MDNKYKHKIILLCKSFNGDLERANVLFESIKKHNKDNIPFYFQIPKSDLKLFQDKMGTDGYEVVFDEDLTDLVNTQSHFTQQLYKMEFYKTNIAEYYFTIDSDMYFIRDFYSTEFINENGIPYVTMHENKALREYSYNIKGNNIINEWWVGERNKIPELFSRKGKLYDYSCSAILYISEVFETLYKEYCEPNKLTFLDLLKFQSSENTWYGEWILYKEFKFYPCEPMFKTFHYPFQYQLSKQLGHTEEMLSQVYLGITMQSNWGSPLKYE
jgi:hypothetical protein